MITDRGTDLLSFVSNIRLDCSMEGGRSHLLHRDRHGMMISLQQRGVGSSQPIPTNEPLICKMLIIMQKFWQRPGSSSAQPPHSAAGNEQSGASGHIFHILTLIMLNQIVSFHLSTQPTDFFVVMNLSNWIKIKQKSKNIWNYVILRKAITENEAGGQSSTMDNVDIDTFGQSPMAHQSTILWRLLLKL